MVQRWSDACKKHTSTIIELDSPMNRLAPHTKYLLSACIIHEVAGDSRDIHITTSRLQRGEQLLATVLFIPANILVDVHWSAHHQLPSQEQQVMFASSQWRNLEGFMNDILCHMPMSYEDMLTKFSCARSSRLLPLCSPEDHHHTDQLLKCVCFKLHDDSEVSTSSSIFSSMSSDC